jgi:hypothetical protein
MSWFESKETKAFKGIIAKREQMAARQAYAKEAQRQARLKGQKQAREAYNRKPIGATLMGIAAKFAAPRKSTGRASRRISRQSFAQPKIPTTLNEAIYG